MVEWLELERKRETPARPVKETEDRKTMNGTHTARECPLCIQVIHQTRHPAYRLIRHLICIPRQRGTV